MKTARQKLIPNILIFLIICLSIIRTQYIVQVATQPSHSFISYYTAALLVSQGVDVSQLYDEAYFSGEVSQITPRIAEYFRPNPPTTALLMLPLAHLNHIEARVVWTFITVVAVCMAVGWILLRLNFSTASALLAVLVVLLYQPLYANFKYAQVYGVLFAGFTAIWHCYKHYRSSHSGILLGIAIITKLSGYLFLLLFLVQRRWRAFGATVGVMLMIGFISLPCLGIDSWLMFIEIFPKYSQRPSSAVTAYQSISGFFKHHLTYHEVWNPAPLVDLPILASALTVLTVLVLVGVTLWMSYRTKFVDLAFSALIILSVVMSPVSVDYHYTIILLPILLLISYMPKMNRWQFILWWIGVLLLSVDYRYHDNQYATTFLSLMAYPKLIGGLVLLSLTLHLMSGLQD